MSRIEVVSKDRVGLVSEISGAISRSGADIRSHSAKVYNDVAGNPMSRFTAIVEFDDSKSNTDELMRRIRRIRGVVSAEFK